MMPAAASAAMAAASAAMAAAPAAVAAAHSEMAAPAMRRSSDRDVSRPATGMRTTQAASV